MEKINQMLRTVQSDVEKEDREKKQKPIGYGKADNKYKDSFHANKKTGNFF